MGAYFLDLPSIIAVACRLCSLLKASNPRHFPKVDFCTDPSANASAFQEAPKTSKKLNGFAGLSLEEDSEDSEPPHLLVGEIESVEKIKKADKLRLCHVDIGEDEPLQIVCGGKNVREGLKVIVAPLGSKIPSNGTPIQKTTIKGVESQGMICGAAELGWEGPVDEAIELGPEAVVGEKAPLTRPVVAEDDDEVLSFTGKKKKKGTAKAVESAVESAQDSEDEEPVVFAGKKKKKGAKEEPKVKDEESEEEAPVFTGKKKKGNKETPKEVEADEDEEESAVFSGKKKKKGKKAAQDDFDKDFEVEEPSEETVSEPPVFAGKKKKGKKAAQDDFDKDFEMEEAPAPAPEVEPAVVDKKGKKGKGKKEDEDIEALLAELEAPKQDEVRPMD
jgi:translation initiation factor 5B